MIIKATDYEVFLGIFSPPGRIHPDFLFFTYSIQKSSHCRVFRLIQFIFLREFWELHFQDFVCGNQSHSWEIFFKYFSSYTKISQDLFLHPGDIRLFWCLTTPAALFIATRDRLAQSPLQSSFALMWNITYLSHINTRTSNGSKMLAFQFLSGLVQPPHSMIKSRIRSFPFQVAMSPVVL